MSRNGDGGGMEAAIEKVTGAWDGMVMGVARRSRSKVEWEVLG